MACHAAVRANLDILAARGVWFVEPGEGFLACGWIGKGRLAEPDEIVAAAEEVLRPGGPLRGQRILVTAGPTYEDFDPVRYLGNRSSGRMGFAIAAEATRRGPRHAPGRASRAASRARARSRATPDDMHMAGSIDRGAA
jgi:phosphopantothenoylcysteine decarboxylase/phosphopantothenate--cysteine ligase